MVLKNENLKKFKIKKQFFFYKKDPKYSSLFLTKFINKVMRNGKKNKAIFLILQSFKKIKREFRKNPYLKFIQVINKTKPIFSIKQTKISGRKIQIPFPISHFSSLNLSIFFFFTSILKRKKEYSFFNKYTKELFEIFFFKKDTNTILKQKENFNLADKNKKNLHYRWQ